METMKAKIIRVGLMVWMACLYLSSTSYSLNIERFVKTNSQGNGTSWENACGSIQKAVNDVVRAGSGTIYVAGGTYKEAFKIPVQSNNMTILGSFPENGLGEQDIQEHPTILDASLISDCCITVDYFCKKIRIESFIVKGGSGNFSRSASGILVMSPSTTIRRCYVVSGKNVGISVVEGKEDNYQTNVHDQVLVEDCLVTGCTVGINAKGALIRKSWVANNRSLGIGLDGGEARNCTISGNGGGGVSMLDGALLYCCHVFNNTGDRTGGIYVHSGGKQNVIYGAAIYNNTGKKGPGSVSLHGALAMESSTVVNNYSLTTTGGVESSGQSWNHLALIGCIFWNNLSAKAGRDQFKLDGSDAKFYYCAIEGGGLLPETDGQNGIINVSSKNEDSVKASVCFRKVASFVGAAATSEQVKAVEGQDFNLSGNSCCIGKGSFFNDVKLDRSCNLSGIRPSKLFNIGAY